MALFLTTQKTIAEIEDVIQRAKQDIYFVSPFVQISEQYRRRLVEADQRNVRIHVVCRMRDLKDDQKQILSTLNHLSLYDSDKLHAKAYANERSIVLTSLNLYEASERNYEMGVLLDADGDTEAYGDAMREVMSVLTHASPISLSSATPSQSRRGTVRGRNASTGSLLVRNARSTTEGHCIRCGTSVAHNPEKPYCPRCFKKWLEFRNPAYADDRCHGCGKIDAGSFSLEKPECYRCYKAHAGKRLRA